MSYSFGGDAAAGVDYQASTTTIDIPAGVTSTTMTITPLPDSAPVGTQTVVLTLTPTGNGMPWERQAYSAAVVLAGNTVHVTSFQMMSIGPTFTWNSSSSATYRVIYKDNLTDPNWTVAGPDIAGAGGVSSWSDTSGAHSQRFYLGSLPGLSVKCPTISAKAPASVRPLVHHS